MCNSVSWVLFANELTDEIAGRLPERRIFDSSVLHKVTFSGTFGGGGHPREVSQTVRTMANSAIGHATRGEFPRCLPRLIKPVTIHWNENLVPFVVAETDADLAYALGHVHAHLRLGQMELGRRFSQGRLSEWVGPLAIDLDHAIRVIGLKQAATQMEKILTSPTRHFLGRYVDGVNDYQDQMTEFPHELVVAGCSPEPWNLLDVLSIARLSSADAGWFTFATLAPLWEKPGWPEFWKKALRLGGNSIPSFTSRSAASPGIFESFEKHGHKGSNCIVISAQKGVTGGALMAGDPHLGLGIPNLWVLAGYKSPSYHVVGLMIPGLPFVAVGRNANIAWGGTNMCAASSDFYDLSGLDSNAYESRQETIKVRFWKELKVTVRTSRVGPVLSDAKIFARMFPRPLGLRWVGHEPSDEISSFLAANRARTFDEFRSAFTHHAVSGQNLLYADVHGNIGQIAAGRIPARSCEMPPSLVLDARNSNHEWKGFFTTADLPFSYNPEGGFIASANNKPCDSGPKVAYLFSSNDRIERLRAEIGSHAKVTLDLLAKLQRDVISLSAGRMVDFLRGHREILFAVLNSPKAVRTFRYVLAFGGRYDAQSRSAWCYELFLYHLSLAAHRSTGAAAHFHRAALAAEHVHDFMRDHLESLPTNDMVELVASALNKACSEFDEKVVWGNKHRLVVKHPFSRIPGLGLRYKFINVPTGGSSTTLMKTSHNVTNGTHESTFGQNARHLFDLSDPDGNYFLLLGGQDGHLGSEALLDQWRRWNDDRKIRIPLDLDSVAREFPYKVTLSPGGGTHNGRATT